MIAKVYITSNGVEYAVKGISCAVVKKLAKYTEFSRVVGVGDKEKVLHFRVSNELVPVYFNV